jgi:hypothetical protein
VTEDITDDFWRRAGILNQPAGNAARHGQGMGSDRLRIRVPWKRPGGFPGAASYKEAFMDDFWPRFLALEGSGFGFLKGSPCQLEHYDVKLQIQNQDHSIDVQGTARGRVIGTTADQLRFLLGSNYVNPDQVSCTLRELTFNGEPAAYHSDKHMHQLLFGRELGEGQTFEIGFSYKTSPVARKCWVNSASDWPIPGLGEGETELCFEGYWLPFANERFQLVTADIQIEDLPGAAVLFNGQLLGTGYEDDCLVHRFSTWMPTFPTVVAGDFQVVSRQIGDGTLAFYHQPGYSDVVETMLDTAESVLSVLVELLGTNPVRDFSLIQLKRTGFGPYAPFPFVLFPFEDIPRLGDGSDWRRVTQMLAHEIGHFWFGVLLRSGPTEQWLSEGFAQYMNLLVTERLYGRDALDKELEDYVSKLSEIETADQAPLCSIPLDHPAQFVLVRTKGAIVLHCLRQECTEDLFWAFLKQLVEDHQGKLIRTTTVENVCSVTGTLRDAPAFFDTHLRSVAKYHWNDDARRIDVTW